MILDPSGERDRLEREVRVHKRLRELLLLFSRGISSSLGLNAALETLTPEIRDILGAGTVEIWLHDRRNRQLVLSASSSDGEPLGARVVIDDTSHYAAGGLRLDRPRLRGTRVIAPLRGWRRALGTLVIDRGKGKQKGVTFDEAEFLEFARELSRQLSVGIENVQLLDDILRQRRLLEDTFNSLVDLVAVMDKELRIVQTNEAFAARVGLKRADIMRRPLSELVGPETLAYVEAADTWQGIVPAVQRRVDDQELDGTFLLTATPLTSADGHTARPRARRARHHAADAARGRARRAARAPHAVGEAGLARPVRRRDRARNEQPAAGGDGTSRAADGHDAGGQAGETRAQADLPGSGSRREDRAQPAGLHRLPPHRAAEDAGRSHPHAARSPAARRASPRPTSRSSAGRGKSCRRCSAIPPTCSRPSSTS